MKPIAEGLRERQGEGAMGRRGGKKESGNQWPVITSQTEYRMSYTGNRILQAIPALLSAPDP